MTPEATAGNTQQQRERLERISPVYTQWLKAHPEVWEWLTQAHNKDEDFRFSAFTSVWESTFKKDFTTEEDFIKALQQFRRTLCLRIAFREVNNLSTVQNSMHELSLLAEFCLDRACTYTWKALTEQLGTPWDEDRNKPARYGILGLGKLGGEELNFCSDIDLIFFYQGKGQCNEKSRLSNSEFFHRFFAKLSTALQKQTDQGFLYNVDLRLRPEGDAGPIAHSYEALQKYYWDRGRTWERLALVKARPVGGNLALGRELLEELHPFRYPRFAPPKLLEEVAGHKVRIEREIVGQHKLDKDIKSGYGGIREIEFLTQALQLLHAGKYPFLQTVSTLRALNQLNRYNLFPKEEVSFLKEAYLFLRKLENCLQMREERRTHTLPSSSATLELIASTLGFDCLDTFHTQLNEVRQGVQKIYKRLLPHTDSVESLQDWILFLSKKQLRANLKEQLEAWFGSNENTQEVIRFFILGGDTQAITQEHIHLFLGIAGNFEQILPELAQPLSTLKAVSHFIDSYGITRKHFFKSCALNPSLFKVLCLLFDRSPYIQKLLCKHPEIIEEVILEAPRRQKPVKRILQEIQKLPQGEDFSQYFWLYVKAEQIRLCISELLYKIPAQTLEINFTRLADAAVHVALKKAAPNGELAVVALGKYGSEELTLGSDLDLLLIAQEHKEEHTAAAKAFIQLLQTTHPLGKLFEVDLRLRPYGQDGPLVCTPSSLEDYHQGPAKLWERQALTRARFIKGPESLKHTFDDFNNKLLYSGAISEEDIKAIWDMRLHIEKTKAATNPELYYKAGPGGLLDIEFLAQVMQLRYCNQYPELKNPNTRHILESLDSLGLVSKDLCQSLLLFYNFLRNMERCLRRSKNAAVDVLEKESQVLAKWLGFETSDDFWAHYHKGLTQTRTTVEKLIKTL